MSEQTPNSSEDLSGAEPSMEDILASIRKIISEDEPIAMESPEDLVPLPVADSVVEASESFAAVPEVSEAPVAETVEDILSSPVSEAAPIQEAPPAETSVDLDLDAMLAEIDMDIDEAPAAELATPEIVEDANFEDPLAESALLDFVETEAAPVDTVSVEALSTEQVTDDEIMSILDTPMDPATDASADLDLQSRVTDPRETTDQEMDALLDGILSDDTETSLVADDVSEQIEIADIDVTDTTSSDEAFGTSLSTVESDEDLELVKSLMADLADDPSIDDADELDALLAIPEVETQIVEPEEAPASEGTDSLNNEDLVAEEEDILGDILDMTLEDELQTHPSDIADDVAAMETENIDANADLDSVEAYGDESLPTLSEIAAAAEADAASANVPVVTGSAMAATAGLAAVGAAVIAQDDHVEPAPTEPDVTQAEALSVPDVTNTPQISESPMSEETSMPVQAVQTDAILDDVTETAAAGAFAQLNQVVEEKAVKAERGDRIGDLVQEALRPMLKEWLDANLKGIVERAVAKEVKRISTGK